MSDAWASTEGDVADFAAWCVDKAEEWRSQESDAQSFTAEAHEVVEGHPLDPELLAKLARMVAMFTAARANARWERTGEPPTLVTVEVKVTAA